MNSRQEASGRIVVIVVILLVAVAADALGEEPVLFQPGPGGNPLEVPHRDDEVWLQEPDLSGQLFTSEIIAAYGLESEIADDFVSPAAAEVTSIRWWGGYWNGYVEPVVEAFTIRIYETDGCLPGGPIAEYYFPSNCNETQLESPLFEYETSIPPIEVQAGVRYWIGVIGTHGFPPQWGRLSAVEDRECDAAFRSAYFSYPQWTGVPDVFGCDCDASFAVYAPVVEGEACCFEDGTCAFQLPEDCIAQGGEPQGSGTDCVPNLCPNAMGACCFADGHCELFTGDDCAAYAGEWLGGDTLCDPNPCTQPSEACCFADGECTYVPAAACEAAGGTPQGAGTDCEQIQCKAPAVGACCLDDTECVVVQEEDCTAFAGTYYAGVPCDPNPCLIPVEPVSWGRVKALFR